MPMIHHSTVEIDAKIHQFNEQIALFLRREKISKHMLSHCIGVSQGAIGKAMGRNGNPQTLTMLVLIKILNFLEYDLVIVKRGDKETIWDNPEKALILNQKRHELRAKEAARKAKRKKGPQVKVKHPRSVNAGLYEKSRQDATSQCEDDMSIFD